jgi:hypothetical protein
MPANASNPDSVGVRPADAPTEAATFAVQAPSIHNTQPWRWRVHGDVLDLLLERGRSLATTDPDGRFAVLSCGAALHHARVHLAAGGWQVAVYRFPDGPGDHLARLRIGPRTPVDPAANRLVRAAADRRTDRRADPGAPLDFDKLRSIRAAVREQGADLKVLQPNQVFDLAAAADHALKVEAEDPGRQAELADWVGGERRAGTGVPAGALAINPFRPVATGRSLRRTGVALVAESHHHASVFAVLHGPGDEPRDWLAGGEALSAGWLTATQLGVAVLPLSIVVEVPGSRDMIRRLLDRSGHPYLVLRFAALDETGDRSARTPRLPSEAIIEQE